MKTFNAKPQEVERKWHLVDLEGQTLGRAATQIAIILRGKNKPTFTPHVDTGDYVVCINADKVKVTGNKAQDKMYYSYTGFIGGLKEANFETLMAKEPETITEHAVKGMLPKGPLGRQIGKKLFVYAGPDHPHAGQQPEPLELKS